MEYFRLCIANSLNLDHCSYVDFHALLCLEPKQEIQNSIIDRRDSMISTFHVPPLASEEGLCDIDRVQSRVPQENFGKSLRSGINRFLA